MLFTGLVLVGTGFIIIVVAVMFGVMYSKISDMEDRLEELENSMSRMDVDVDSLMREKSRREDRLKRSIHNSILYDKERD